MAILAATDKYDPLTLQTLCLFENERLKLFLRYTLHSAEMTQEHREKWKKMKSFPVPPPHLTTASPEDGSNGTLAAKNNEFYFSLPPLGRLGKCENIKTNEKTTGLHVKREDEAATA